MTSVPAIAVAGFFHMRRKKKNAGFARSKRQPAAEPKAAFSSPFKDLKKILAERGALNNSEPKPAAMAKPPAAENRPAAAPSDPPLDDEAALSEAYRGVRPLEGGR